MNLCVKKRVRIVVKRAKKETFYWHKAKIFFLCTDFYRHRMELSRGKKLNSIERKHT